MLDNWDKRHGIWKLYKHILPETSNTNSIAARLPLPSSGVDGPYHVVIKFMYDSLELNITLGHQLMPDTLPQLQMKEDTLYNRDSEGNLQPVIRKTKTSVKVMHWTLLNIEFRNPSRAMLRIPETRENSNSIDSGDDIRLTHYIILRDLTPSRLAHLCPNTKSLETTLSTIAQVNFSQVKQSKVQLRDYCTRSRMPRA